MAGEILIFKVIVGNAKVCFLVSAEDATMGATMSAKDGTLGVKDASKSAKGASKARLCPPRAWP